MTELIVIDPEPDAIDRAVQIIQMAHEKAGEIPTNVIRAGAILALQVGANPNPLAGELYIYPIKGKYVPYLGVAYYRRIAEETGARVMFAPGHNSSNEPRAMTAEERAAYGMKEGRDDRTDAAICRGFRGDRLMELLDRGVPWRDAVELLSRVGVGFLRDEEKRDRNGNYMDPPNGRSWQWKCNKRAEVDLYKKLGVVARSVVQLEAAAITQAQQEEETVAEGSYTLEDANADLF